MLMLSSKRNLLDCVILYAIIFETFLGTFLGINKYIYWILTVLIFIKFCEIICYRKNLRILVNILFLSILALLFFVLIIYYFIYNYVYNIKISIYVALKLLILMICIIFVFIMLINSLDLVKIIYEKGIGKMIDAFYVVLNDRITVISGGRERFYSIVYAFTMDSVVYEYKKREGSLSSDECYSQDSELLNDFDKVETVIKKFFNEERIIKEVNRYIYKRGFDVMCKAYIEKNYKVYEYLKDKIKIRYNDWKETSTKFHVIKRVLIKKVCDLKISPWIITSIYNFRIMLK